MPERCEYPLGNLSFQTGDVGRLMTLNVLPVVAGDSITYGMKAVFRLAPFRRPLIVDPRIDVVHCFVPHRHVYGDTWINFIKEGVNETVSFPSYTLNHGYNNCYFIPWIRGRSNNAAIPKWLIDGYMNIWNRYFRPPQAGIDEQTYSSQHLRDGDLSPGDGRNSYYGFPCADMPTPWNTGHATGTAQAPEYPDDIGSDGAGINTNTAGVPNSSHILTTWGIEEQSAKWKTLLEREWTSTYYDDLMSSIFGGGASVDADERPHFLGQTTQYFSGFDVYGTSGTEFGAATGRGETMVSSGFPRRFFPEHGAIWTLAVIRYPMIHELECHYLAKKANPTWREISGDPEIVKTQRPQNTPNGDWFLADGTVDLGRIPFGQWYRYQPNIVNSQFDALNGFPFRTVTPLSLQRATLVDSGDFKETFESEALRHWNASCRFDVSCLRVVPPASASAFVGSSLM